MQQAGPMAEIISTNQQLLSSQISRGVTTKHRIAINGDSLTGSIIAIKAIFKSSLTIPDQFAEITKSLTVLTETDSSIVAELVLTEADSLNLPLADFVRMNAGFYAELADSKQQLASGTCTFALSPAFSANFSAGGGNGGGSEQGSAYEQSFNQSNLVNGVLTIEHNLHTYPSGIAIYNNFDQLVSADSVHYLSADAITISLFSFLPIEADWLVSITV